MQNPMREKLTQNFHSDKIQKKTVNVFAIGNIDWSSF